MLYEGQWEWIRKGMRSREKERDRGKVRKAE